MANGDTGKMFEPLTINGVTFSNRLLRSSVGGRTAGYDGTVTDVWKNFEKRFADGGVGGIISTTFNVNRHRKTPLEYPPISEDKYVAPLARFITEIKSKNTCKYLIQIGDPGHATQTGLFPEKEDSHSSSWGFDLLYGYNNTRTRMSGEEIQSAIDDFANAAKRVQDAGADGIELTAAKGYLIHQFLNPGFNRRKDEWGGSADKRFRLLKLITEAVREKVGKDFLFGIRLAAADYNYLPLQSFIFRCPWVFPLKHHFMGNSLEQMLEYARDLKEIPVDFLHVVSGFGFPSPRVTPGKFPLAEAKMVLNATRHLSLKACVRSTVLNATPEFIASPLANIGWRRHQGINRYWLGERRYRLAAASGHQSRFCRPLQAGDRFADHRQWRLSGPRIH